MDLTSFLMGRITAGGTEPTGTINISTNGEHDVTSYATANVSVSAVSKLPSVIDGSVTEITAADLDGMGYMVRGSAFYGCTKLTKVELPEGVQLLGMQAFQQCVNLTTVILPSTTAYIYTYALDGNITSLTCKATTPPYLASSGSIGFSSNYTIYVPAASVDSYKSASNWSAFADHIQAIP